MDEEYNKQLLNACISRTLISAQLDAARHFYKSGKFSYADEYLNDANKTLEEIRTGPANEGTIALGEILDYELQIHEIDSSLNESRMREGRA